MAVAITSALIDSLLAKRKHEHVNAEKSSTDSGKRPSTCSSQESKRKPISVRTPKTSSTSVSSGIGSSTLSTDNLSESFESEKSRTPNTSAYFSSESSPNSLRTPEVIIRQNRKRSFSNLSEEEGYSPDRSFRSTFSYHTPSETPPWKKSRWSQSLSPATSDYGNFLDRSLRFFSPGRHSQTQGDRVEIQPRFIGYQMIGDSQFCRFGQQLLGLQRVPCPNSPGRIGICVSGQTISDLHERIKEKFYPLSDKIILMIGTNDFLRNHGTDVNGICSALSALIRTLQETVSNIVLLTLPPIPKLERRLHQEHFKMLHKYNTFIRSLACGDKVRVADISPMYITEHPIKTCNMNYFELTFFNSRRPDLIHLNRNGLEVIKRYILEHFLC